jgi:hypothetical protein
LLRTYGINPAFLKQVTKGESYILLLTLLSNPTVVLNPDILIVSLTDMGIPKSGGRYLVFSNF